MPVNWGPKAAPALPPIWWQEAHRAKVRWPAARSAGVGAAGDGAAGDGAVVAAQAMALASEAIAATVSRSARPARRDADGAGAGAQEESEATAGVSDSACIAGVADFDVAFMADMLAVLAVLSCAMVARLEDARQAARAWLQACGGD